jgi:hypothetical protein
VTSSALHSYARTRHPREGTTHPPARPPPRATTASLISRLLRRSGASMEGGGSGGAHGGSGHEQHHHDAPHCAASDDGEDGTAALTEVLPLSVLGFLDLRSVAVLEGACRGVRETIGAQPARCCASLTVSKGRRIDGDALAAFRKFGGGLQTLQVRGGKEWRGEVL